MNMFSEEPEKDDSERWMLSYLDFITLLCCFFILMYSMSRVDQEKFDALKSAMNSQFGGTDYIVGESPGPSIMVGETAANGLHKGVSEESQMQEVQQKLQATIDNKQLQSNVTIFSDERGIVIRVRDSLFFPSGKADFSESAKKTIDIMGETMKTLPNYVHIEGHTDNVPIHNDEFSSNWQLSNTRASNVVEELIRGSGYDPHLLSATGYGEYRPIASNNSPEGRQMNRHVDIVILKSEMNKAEPNITVQQ